MGGRKTGIIYLGIMIMMAEALEPGFGVVVFD